MAYDTNALVFRLPLTFPLLLNRVFDKSGFWLSLCKDEFGLYKVTGIFIEGHALLRYNLWTYNQVPGLASHSYWALDIWHVHSKDWSVLFYVIVIILKFRESGTQSVTGKSLCLQQLGYVDLLLQLQGVWNPTYGSRISYKSIVTGLRWAKSIKYTLISTI